MRNGKIILVLSVVLVAVVCAAVLIAHFKDPRVKTSDEYSLSSFSSEQLASFSSHFQSVEDAELAFLQTCVMPDGSIAFRPVDPDGKNTVNQYFSIYAALALLAAKPDDSGLGTVSDHLAWSFQHMATDKPDEEGLLFTIGNYDETLADGKVVFEEYTGYDAADSELALFLTEVERYVAASGDVSPVMDHADQIRGDIRTLLGLIDSDGLSYGKPSYHVAYLMDNCEVYQGLKDAASLVEHRLLGSQAADEGDRQLAIDVESAISNMQRAFESVLWDGADGHYLAYAGQEGFDWGTFYADATSQLFPAIFGAIAPNSVRATSVYDAFCDAYDWTTMDYYTSRQTSFFWSVIAWGAASVGDVSRLSDYLDTYGSLTADGHPYPAYSGDSAMVVLACERGKALCDGETG